MRDYAQILPRFWTGETGRAIRAAGAECQVVAIYLMTCPSSNMIGLYYLPLPTLCHETGLSLEGASKALRRVCELGFAHFDPSEEVVFVPMMARYQIGESLEAKDKRVKGVARELQNYRKCKFYNEFVKLYEKAFHLRPALREVANDEAPSKPLRSQEQEQEQEQEQDIEDKGGVGGGALRLPEGMTRFWDSLPDRARERSSKRECLEQWRRQKLEPQIDAVLAGLEAWKKSAKWLRNGGEFIEGGHRFLKNRKWLEHPPAADAKLFTDATGGFKTAHERRMAEINKALEAV